MAKFNIVVDTEANTMQVTVNGKNMENVRFVRVSAMPDYKDPNEVESISVSVESAIKDDAGVCTYTTTMAKLNEITEEKSSQTQKDIGLFLRKIK